MLYHASQTPGIETLEPRTSNEGVPRIYFSDKRENVLVYLSNAVEKTCREDGFVHAGKWQKWASYGFTADGLLHFSEYYENALEDTYAGVSAYIYTVEPSDAVAVSVFFLIEFTNCFEGSSASCKKIHDEGIGWLTCYFD